MIAFKEFIKRSTDGPVMSEHEFDVKLSRRLRSLASEFNIHLKPEEVICDDATADSIFQAAVEMLVQVGIYNVDTTRVIQLSRQEVDATCRETPHQVSRGGGKDVVTIPARKHNSTTPPYIFRVPLRNFRTPCLEVFLAETIEAYLADRSALGDVARELKEFLAGIEVKSGVTNEVIWEMAIAKWKLAIAKAMGQPDMYMEVGAAHGVPALLFCFKENLYKKYHIAVPVHIMPELKLNWDRLTLAFTAREMDAPRWVSANSIIGGYARNAEEAAILVLTSVLGQLSYTAESWAHLDPVDLKGRHTTRATLMAHSGACRAAERNVCVPTSGLALVKNGLGTAESLFEKAAATVEHTCSGIAYSWGYQLHPGPDGKPRTDLDGELVMKIANAASGIERNEANALIDKILKLYEGRLDQAEKGKHIAYYYDIKTLTPSQELVDLHKRAEERLTSLGVPLS